MANKPKKNKQLLFTVIVSILMFLIIVDFLYEKKIPTFLFNGAADISVHYSNYLLFIIATLGYIHGITIFRNDRNKEQSLKIDNTNQRILSYLSSNSLILNESALDFLSKDFTNLKYFDSKEQIIRYLLSYIKENSHDKNNSLKKSELINYTFKILLDNKNKQESISNYIFENDIKLQFDSLHFYNLNLRTYKLPKMYFKYCHFYKSLCLSKTIITKTLSFKGSVINDSISFNKPSIEGQDNVIINFDGVHFNCKITSSIIFIYSKVSFQLANITKGNDYTNNSKIILNNDKRDEICLRIQESKKTTNQRVDVNLNLYF